ncbi:hypothetical protein INS49_003899 [Diaporthe citri]|uniref:uncharacterized protein n=1 Tax=Diaporthe citri TaxID=83186 RepID=UPI001C7F2857|nr:uncharacterized protein INS49_003899 [Diaporthe citri]KAG6354818.1 hypothetical protein INS49_003899 [Diaporthe citri]
MPTCMSCGSFYSRDGTDEAANFGELDRAVSGFEGAPAYLNLDWPSTVEFSSPDEVQDVNIRNILKQLEDMLEEQGNHYQDQRPKSTVDIKSSVTYTREEPSSEIEVGRNFDRRAARQGQERDPDDRSAGKKSPIYDPLTGVDEVRLLRLSAQRATDDQVLHGFLESTSLSIRPEYTAVSYTWADADGNRDLNEVMFLGSLWLPLPITSNCAAALRRLRSGHHVQTLWVDSICINQSNQDEKSHQVGLMRDIFSRANSVTIFLGQVIWAAVDDHLAVRALFDRPYWSRIWVIQEVLLSKRAIVVLGEAAIPLKSLLEARLVEPRREFGVPPWLRLGKALPIGDFNGLSTLLTETSNCLATDPKDMVFALLGLIQGAHLEGLVADYSKSVYEIRIGIAAYFLIRHRQTNILKSAALDAGSRRHDRLLPGLPSWVPSWDHYPSDEPSFANTVGVQYWFDLNTGSMSTNWNRKMTWYDTLAPEEASNKTSDCSSSKTYPFRVLKGTGALLVEAYPLLHIDSAPFRGAFKYRDVTRKSILITPTVSPVRWGIYATRKWLDKSYVFGLPGDWIVEIPGCDDLFLLRQISSLPGTYHIVSVCGLAIVVAQADGRLPDSEALPVPTDGSAHVLPKYRNDELISRLVIFNRHQLQFLENWELLTGYGTALGPLSETPGSASPESSASLSSEDMTRYIQWADRISSDPLVAMQPTSLEDTLKNVSTCLDRWQDLDLWNRIVTELEAVSWPGLLQALADFRTGIWSDQPAEDQTLGVLHSWSFTALASLRVMTMKLRDLLLELTSRGTLLQPASMMDTFGPLFEAIDEADTSTILEVFRANEDEIERHLKELESHLEFMRDSLPQCCMLREKFAQRQVLKQMYRRSEFREFLVY